MAQEKLERPECRLTFFVFELDTVAMEIRLPPYKLRELNSWSDGSVQEECAVEKT